MHTPDPAQRLLAGPPLDGNPERLDAHVARLRRVEARLRVDWIRCDGYGLCGDFLPDVIELDEWRYPIVDPRPIEGGLLHAAQRAVDCCPMKALILESAPSARQRR